MTTPMQLTIGTPGIPWGDAERAEWLSQQSRRRNYRTDVVSAIERLSGRFDVHEYGQIDYPPDRYGLFAVRSRDWREECPIALVTGGVHGYETSGVHGALEFLHHHAADYAQKINLLVAPCVSPWAYEHIQRWNANAIDPNRSFCDNSPAEEAAALMRLLAPTRGRILLHIDLHETTDSDESEFRPALAARDGETFQPGVVPDGFCLIDDSANPQPDFQRALIDAVAKVTRIAPTDAKGEISGLHAVAPGVVQVPARKLGLCTGLTGARYTTTTEIYPDSPSVTPHQCNAAQVAAVCAAIEFALGHRR